MVINDQSESQDLLFRIKELEDKIKAIKDSAHDLSNVLLAISGYTELAVINIAEKPKVLYYLNQIIQSSHRAKDILNNTLFKTT